MKQILYLASLALCAALLPFNANTQSEDRSFTPPSPITGSWSFESARYRGGACVMSGHMNIRPTAKADVYACNFTALEDCTGQDTWVVEQSCKAVNRDGQLSIKSNIENFLEAKEFTDSYVPDNFSLQVESRERMSGLLVSAVSAPVEFRRKPDNLS